ncbi:prolipoprotein diacylglyceryl transferase [Millionella massiliensis]|uniref:prolipoprotein diacylglyceryl transferase n=1 Tax=Millionella massiliensis TaxID=1871023 RepID=UPI0023A87C36|nr:prolipoprotein diacylglyceryl transferase [Millionella massiliensis]
MTPLSIVWDPNPIAFSIGSLEVAWYGISWAAALLIALWIYTRMVKREGLDPRIIDSGFLYGVLATVIGSRLGHCLFYEPQEYLLDPFMSDFPWIKLLDIRGGGMASHGAAVGLLIGLWLFVRKWKLPYIWVLDRVAVMVPIGGALVRLGNLMNSEIYGDPTSLPWGFIFVQKGETVPMHPTQIYEAVAYLAIFLLLAHLYWRTQLAQQKRGVIFGLFLILLFTVRFVIESIKLPQEVWEQNMALNMGQILSLPFIVAGVAILWWAWRRPAQPYTNMPLAENAPKTNSKNRK